METLSDAFTGLERPSREFLIAGSPLLLYNSPPEVDAVLHGHKKPIASEVCSFLPFSL